MKVPGGTRHRPHNRRPRAANPRPLRAVQPRYAGRKHPEEEHPYRGPYQRDRDRIVHSAAFRRLGRQDKVHRPLSDYHRTRLTHTNGSRFDCADRRPALRLNEDLIGRWRLVHDIGHPPYGHAGEDVLRELLADEGGFSHNRYALTLVEELEIRSPLYPGLNLTREVLESQTLRIDKSRPEHPLLEAQVVDAADSMTYDAHDSDDAVKLGLVTIDELLEIPLVARVCRAPRSRFARVIRGWLARCSCAI